MFSTKGLNQEGLNPGLPAGKPGDDFGGHVDLDRFPE
jgi:hypothetical protein